MAIAMTIFLRIGLIFPLSLLGSSGIRKLTKGLHFFQRLDATIIAQSWKRFNEIKYYPASPLSRPQAPETVKRCITFAGCGGLYTYMFGIASYIQDNFNVGPESGTIFASASAGAFPAYLLASGLDVEEFHEVANQTLLQSVEHEAQCDPIARRDGRLRAMWRWNDAVVKHFISAVTGRLDRSEACTLVRGRHFISLTELPSLTNHLVSDFEDLDDFMLGVIASAFIPIYDSQGFLTARWRGKRFIDGGLTDNTPVPYNDIPSFVITPSMWRDHTADTGAVSFVRADWEWANRKYRQGKEDAEKHHSELAVILHPKIDQSTMGIITPDGMSACG